MTSRRTFAFTVTLAAFLTLSAPLAVAQSSLLNVSYDVMRDFYKDYNPAFVKHWKDKTGETVTINSSFGGSSKQARAVIDGLDADVITMNQSTDIDALAKNGGLVPVDWAKRLPHNAVPFTSATVFIVRKGNPKAIHDWGDLIKPGTQVIVPHPKTSGNGRYSYLSGWAWAQRQPGGNDAKAQDYVAALFKNVPVLDAGGRGATTTFMQRTIGDVLITFENEAELIAKEFGRGQFEVVYPSLSLAAEPPVSVVDKVVDKKGSRRIAQAYLDYLYTPQGQEIAAQNYLRPRDAAVFKRYEAQFPPIKLLTISEAFGSLTAAQKTHFDDGGLFDRIYQTGAKR